MGQDMKWHRKVPRKASVIAAAATAVALFALFAASYAFLFAGPVRGSGTGGVPGCKPVLFAAATGSAEYPHSDQDLGASPELNVGVYRHMVDLLAAQWGADQVGVMLDVRVLTYAPNSLDVLTSGLGALKFDPHLAVISPGYDAVLAVEARNALKYSIPTYLDSEHEGVSELTALFNTTRQSCPTTKFVLAGYSQGAMVVHDFLNHLAATRDRTGQQSIIGAVLLGDPDRVRYSGVTEFGTAISASYGACYLPQVVGIARCATSPQDVAPMFQARTVSVCMHDDPVCDSSDFVPDLAHNFIVTLGSPGSFINLCKAIHGSYSYVQPATLAGQLVGRWVAASV